MDNPPTTWGQPGDPAGTDTPAHRALPAVSDPSPSLCGMDPASLPLFMTAAEVCQLLHIGSSTLQDWRERGVLEGVQPDGRTWRYCSLQPAIQRAVAEATRYVAVTR